MYSKITKPCKELIVWTILGYSSTFQKKFLATLGGSFSKINYKLLSKAEHTELNLTSFVNDPLSSLRTLVQLANCAELTKAGQLLCLLTQWSQGICDWSFGTHC